MKPSPLHKASWTLFFTGCALVMMTVLAYFVTAIYEWIFPPTDMHLLGLLTAVMMLYVAPVGGLLVVLGLLLWLVVFFVGRKNRITRHH